MNYMTSIDICIEKKIDCWPTHPLLNPVWRQIFIKIFGATDVTEIAVIIVIFWGTSKSKRIMLSNCIMDHFDKLFGFLIEEFGLCATDDTLIIWEFLSKIFFSNNFSVI